MKMTFGLELNQSQKMILTKELKQSLDILQMNRDEIEQIILKETIDNPTLEIEKNDEIDWEKYLTNLRDSSYKIYSNFYEHNPQEDLHSEPNLLENLNMYDYLTQQLGLLDIESIIYKTGCYIIRTLNNDGYFKEDIDVASKNLGISNEDFMKSLQAVHSLEPYGIGARNITECLLIQIKEKKIEDETLKNIIYYDIENLAAHKYKELCKKYNLNNEDLKKYIEQIKKLEPCPARQFNNLENQYILPDVIVERNDNKIEVRLNNESLPNLKISTFYEKLLKENVDLEVKQYIKDKIQKSITLIKNIQQRKKTVLIVATQIVNHQEEFIIHGKSHMKPLTLKEVADITGFHESTISRTVNGKYILTPKGLFELKYFFSGGVKDSDGELVSNINIKNVLKNIVDCENKKKPLSDRKICDILNERGILISRRTVAKYREELDIASSSMRKEI